MAALRSALRHLAPAARFLSKSGGRGGSGPSFTPVRRKHSTGGGVSYYMIFGDEPFDLRTPVTWFAIIGYAIGVTYKIKMQTIDHETPKAGAAAILKDQGMDEGFWTYDEGKKKDSI